jgi:hypothetical protein
MFKAAYFHPSLLFYFLSFCAFLLVCKMIVSPSWKLSILAGIVLGVAHLTKAAILPGLALFLLFSSAKAVYMLYIRLTNKTCLSTFQFRKQLVHRLLSVTLVILTFLGTVYPYIRTTKRIWGRYFYNACTTFYMWYDSWDEAKHGTVAHGDRKGWPDMPPEEIPSFNKYLREHTVQQIVDRVLSGLEKLNVDCRNSYGYYKYVWIYFVFSLVMVAMNSRYNIQVATRYPFLLGFCLSCFVVYLLGYAWYMPIATGNRFILAQFLPFMFTVSYVICKQPSSRVSIRLLGVQIRPVDVLNAIVPLVLIPDIYFILTERIVTMYGGS